MFAFAGLALLCGCASQRPVFYPNEYYKKAGKAQAERDVKLAIKMAEHHGISYSSEYVKGGKRVVVGSAAGAATGAAVGAISSGGVGLGAVAGAVGGASGGIVSWMFADNPPSSLYRKFVDTYLKNKGYQVMGWQ